MVGKRYINLQHVNSELNCSLVIGRLNINIYCPSKSWKNLIFKNYKHFINKINKKAIANIIINPQKYTSRKKLSVSFNKIWEISRSDFYSQSSKTLKTTQVFIDKNKYSFDSWLRIFFTLLSLKKNGILLHSAGFSDNKNTFIFPGKSGKGKSTIIKILGKENALSDELTYVYKYSKNIYASSTPFWGELKRNINKIYNAKLKNIFFIEHGKTNELIRLSDKEALKKILQTVLFFHKSPKHITNILTICLDIIKKNSVYQLNFTKKSTKKDIITIIHSV